MLRWDSKKAGETDDRDLDWSLRLDPGDSITGSTWTVLGSPTSITVVSASFVSPKTKIVLSGGRDGSVYTFKNTITTALGSSPLYEYVQMTIDEGT